MAHWITDSQDEQTFEDLFRDADQINIPIFQRQYVWKRKQFEELTQDIGIIKEGIEESQFLGAIVSYERPREREVVGRLRSVDIVDGQQRLLTLYIFLMAIAEHLSNDNKDDAAELVQEFLLLPNRRGLEINTRIIPAFDDRSQFRLLWDRLNSPDLLQDKLKTNPPKPSPPSGDSSGFLVKQYKRIDRYIKKNLSENESETKDYLLNLLNIITRQISFVHLKLNDASVATKIFERLNFSGVKVGIVDLVRNEVFSRVADSPSDAKRIFDTKWKPFEESFQGHSESFFFPYCLIHNSNVKKSELFTELRKIWMHLGPEEIIQHMEPYQLPFNAINKTGILPAFPEISENLRQLISMKRPSVVYPFVMKLLVEVQKGQVNESIGIEILNALESFLVRRAIVGYEPTGLHALFKSLWNELEDIDTKSFIDSISSKPTIQWPNNSDVKKAILNRPLAKTRICNYLLVEYDKSLPGDNPSSTPTIEHVLPQKYDEDSIWEKHFSKEEHKLYVDILANIIPLSSPLNSSLQKSGYKVKSDRYKKESMFTTARHVADKWDEWSPNVLKERSEVLSGWVVKRWEYHPNK